MKRRRWTWILLLIAAVPSIVLAVEAMTASTQSLEPAALGIIGGGFALLAILWRWKVRRRPVADQRLWSVLSNFNDVATISSPEPGAHRALTTS